MMKTNFFLTTVKSWMEASLTKLGEKCDIRFQSCLDRISRRKPNYTSSIDPHNDRPSCTKIFYASRTHSQLSQVVPELRKLRREVHHNLVLSPPSHPSTQIPTKDEARKRKHELGDFDADSFSGRSETRFVSLGSRRQLCLNEKLKAKGGDLDERCRELLQGIYLKSFLPIAR